MIGKLPYIVAGITCLLGVAEGVLEVPCYGYGNVFGTPSNYIEDDMNIVKELKVGQDGTYVAYVKYLFEGQNYIQMGYRKKGDENFSEAGNPHGSKN